VEEIKRIQIGKEKVNLSLFAEVFILKDCKIPKTHKYTLSANSRAQNQYSRVKSFSIHQQ
jgi:hypothetical protein